MLQKDDMGLRYLREIAAILIALVVLAGFMLMMWETHGRVGAGKEGDFNQSKELLQIFTGFMGIVIGYYFTRVSTETRAEKAESAARRANDDARGAIEGHRQALDESSAAHKAAGLAKSELRNLTAAAKRIAGSTGERLTLGVTRSGAPVEDNELRELRDAIERAERIL